MLKVIVADDEEKICQLILKLVDWESLGMEVVGTAANGLEALEKIRQLVPDVVITDIRMPGCDGMEMIRQAKQVNGSTEFVIISGYRHFEYAQTAIKYGVSDYLLKPIKKEELTSTLQKIRERYLEKTEQLTFEERVRLVLKNDAGRLRTSYFSGILYPKSRGQESLTLDEINNQYHYSFRPGCFQMICIKFDRIPSRDQKSLEFLADKTSQLADQVIREFCHDFELYVESSYVYMLLNYQEEEKKAVRHQIKSMLDGLIVLESIMEGLRVTIGAGDAVNSALQIRQSLRTSRWRVEQRLISGAGTVIDCEVQETADLAESQLFYDFNAAMTKALESLETEQVHLVLQKLKRGLLDRENITGHEVLQMSKEVCNLYLFCMKNQKITLENESGFVERYNTGADDCDSVDALFGFLTAEIEGSFSKAAQQKKQEDNRPIRTAKKYMKEHYMEPITLEDVSAMAGFNPTYFSSLFKKETGSSFLEYLSGVRMDEAKRLLRETGIPVAVVCEHVGYSDVKYFTKAFIKYTGLKPNEYRKLYS